MNNRIETDKLTAEYSLRIPEITKNLIDMLTKSQKSKLNERLLITIAKQLHDARFDPNHYLKIDL